MRVDDRRALFAADYMSNYRCFTHDAERFPDPMALSTKLHDQGIKGVWMLDPGIARCEGYDAYDDGTAKNVWVCTADGTSPFVGKVWPGDCVFPDFSSRRVREWWAARVQSFALSFGADGIWVDMNESAPSRYVPSPFPGAFRGRSQLGLDPSFGLGRTSVNPDSAALDRSRPYSRRQRRRWPRMQCTMPMAVICRMLLCTTPTASSWHKPHVLGSRRPSFRAKALQPRGGHLF